MQPPNQEQQQADDRLPEAGDTNEADSQALIIAEQITTKLNALGLALVSKRSRAIEWRAQSGIEQDWIEDEEAYEGVDDANRGQEGKHRLRKPAATTGASVDTKPDPARSTVFLNITRPYVDAGAARVGDMLLPMDDRNFEVKPTPIPELVDAAEAGQKPIDMPLGMGGEEPVAQQQAQGQVVAQQAPGTPDPAEVAKQAIEKANKSAKKAETQIDDWLNECQFHGQARMLIDDCAKLGSGIIKGPYPANKKVQMLRATGELAQREEIKPISTRVDPWNFYPDAGCGENIHNGSCTWERDDVTSKTLRELKGAQGVLDSQIDLCLTEGPKSAMVAQNDRTQTPIRDDTNFEIWYYHGYIGQEDLSAAGCDCSQFTEPGKEHDVLPVMLTIVNDRVIRAALNPLDNGKFPYDVMVWQKRVGMPWGAGIARQIRTPQRILNAATRNMMENGGLSAGPQIILLRGVVEPADGLYQLTPRKIWYAKADASLNDLKAAFMAVNIECRQEDLMRIIEFAMKLAEDVTGLPMLLQGQQGKAPDTVGGMTLLNNNASSVLRRIARIFDDRIIEPHITRYYDWLMQNGTDQEAKGLYIIDARGSSVLVERDLQNQAIIQMAAMATNPSYGVDPRKYFKELCMAQRLDPARFQYDDATWRKIQENMQKQPQDPRIAVAQMRTELETKLAQMESSLTQQENARDRQLDLMLKELELATTQNLSGDQIKAKLADTVIKVRAQTKLALITPPTEPAGRAPAGQAYQR